MQASDRELEDRLEELKAHLRANRDDIDDDDYHNLKIGIVAVAQELQG